MTKVLKYLSKTSDFGRNSQRGHERLPVHCDADYAKQETGRRSGSGVAVMYGRVIVSATSRTQHCETPSTTKVQYVAIAEGAKEGLFIEEVLMLLIP